MFNLGDYVVSANEGVCVVQDLVSMRMPGSVSGKKCYLIVPVEKSGAKLYVPVDSNRQQVRPIMTRQEALTLLHDITTIEEAWIANDKQREQVYKDAIFSCDPRKLVSILKTMHNRGNRRVAEGKKITTVDERYFRIAEKNLHNELAFVLDKDAETIRKMIQKTVNEAERK